MVSQKHNNDASSIVKKSDDKFIRLDIILALDRQTDRQTDRRICHISIALWMRCIKMHKDWACTVVIWLELIALVMGWLQLRFDCGSTAVRLLIKVSKVTETKPAIRTYAVLFIYLGRSAAARRSSNGRIARSKCSRIAVLTAALTNGFRLVWHRHCKRIQQHMVKRVTSDRDRVRALGFRNRVRVKFRVRIWVRAWSDVTLLTL